MNFTGDSRNAYRHGSEKRENDMGNGSSTLSPPSKLPLRRHYLTLTQAHIDAQIEQLRERRADIDIEIQRINRRLYGPAEIPVIEKVTRKCVEVRGE